VRGKPVSRAARKELDVVIITARYAGEDGRLSLAQGYQRRGPVWGDVQLFDRRSLLGKIGEGKRVFAGRCGQIEGDFEPIAAIRVIKSNSHEALVGGENNGPKDDLGLPLF
jgi:hypothetical protein